MTREEIADLDARGFAATTRARAKTSTSRLRTNCAPILTTLMRARGIRHHPSNDSYLGRNGPAAGGPARSRLQRFCRGPDPEFTYNGEGRGPAYDPTRHDPLLVPTTGAAGPAYSLDDFKWSVDRQGRPDLRANLPRRARSRSRLGARRTRRIHHPYALLRGEQLHGHCPARP